jgi:hypothetical protein
MIKSNSFKNFCYAPLVGAEALDDVPARFRPITLNMLGLALQDFDQQMTGRPERLIQGYMETAIAQPEIKEIAPSVVEKMITAVNTKEPRTVAELTAETGLSSQEVLVCLVLLARKGLVRQLDAVQSLWEISHDFVARQFALLLGRLHPSVWPRLAMFAAPILFVLILSGVVIGIPWYVHEQAFSALRALGIAVTQDNKSKGLIARFPRDADDNTLRSALPNLSEVGVSAMTSAVPR